MKKFKFLILVGLFVFLLLILTDVYLVLLKPLDSGTKTDDDFGDILLVLGGGLKKLNEIGVSTKERIELAVKLFKKKKRLILVSDGSLYQKSPAIKMIKDFILSKGIPEKYILFEGKSQTTFENFVYTKDIINKSGLNGVIVCTSPYHQKRSQIIKDFMGMTDYKVSSMEESEIYQANSIKQRLRNLKLIAREYFGLIKFRILRH